MIQFERAIEFLSKENIKVSIMTYLREIMTSSWRHNIQTLRYYICFDISESGLVWGVGFYLNRASPQLKCSTLKGVSSTNPIFYLFNVYTKVTVYHFEVQIFDLKKFHLLQYLHFMIVVQSELLSAIRGPPSGLLSAGYHFDGLMRTDCN